MYEEKNSMIMHTKQYRVKIKRNENSARQATVPYIIFRISHALSVYSFVMYYEKKILFYYNKN